MSALLLSLALSTTPSGASEPEILARAGDNLVSGLWLDTPEDVQVGSDGEYLVLGRVMVTSGQTVSALWGDLHGYRAAFAVEGEPAPGPGPSVDYGPMRHVVLGEGGRYALTAEVVPGVGLPEETAVFDGPYRLLARRQVSTAPSLPAGTAWESVLSARPLGVRGLVTVATLDDPSVKTDTTYQNAFVQAQLTPRGLQERVLWRSGDQPPGAPGPLRNVPEWLSGWDMNASGTLLWIGHHIGGPNQTFVQLWMDDTFLIEEGDPFPGAPQLRVTGFGSPLLNGHGDFLWAIATGSHAGAQRMLAVGLDEILVAHGDPMPGIPGEFVSRFRGYGFADNATWASIVQASPSGDMVVVANDRVLLTEGDVLPDGSELSFVDRIDLSPSGEWLIVSAAQTDPSEPDWPQVTHVLRWNLSDLLQPLPPAPGTPGIVNTWEVEHAVVGHEVALVLGTTLGGSSAPCGGGSVALDVGGPTRLLGADLADDHGRVAISAPLPATSGGRQLHVQAVDLTRCVASDPVTFTP